MNDRDAAQGPGAQARVAGEAPVVTPQLRERRGGLSLDGGVRRLGLGQMLELEEIRAGGLRDLRKDQEIRKALEITGNLRFADRIKVLRKEEARLDPRLKVAKMEALVQAVRFMEPRARAESDAALESACADALRQIRERRHFEPFQGEGIRSTLLAGLAIHGKSCRVTLKELKKPGRLKVKPAS